MSRHPRSLTPFETIDVLSADRESLRKYIDSLEERVKDYTDYEAAYMKKCNDERDECDAMRTQLSDCNDDKQRFNREFEHVSNIFKENVKNLGDCERNLIQCKKNTMDYDTIRQELSDINVLYEDLVPKYDQAVKKNREYSERIYRLEGEINQLKKQSVQNNDEEIITRVIQDLSQANDRIKNILLKNN